MFFEGPHLYFLGQGSISVTTITLLRSRVIGNNDQQTYRIMLWPLLPVTGIDLMGVVIVIETLLYFKK